MMKLIVLLTMTLLFPYSVNGSQDQELTFDIIIYGGTSSGVMAALQASKMGKSVAIVNPTNHLGGATSNGLSSVDIKNHDIVGGLAHHFFLLVGQYYQQDSAWKFEKKHPMPDQQGQPDLDDPTMWLVEPKVAELIFKSQIANAKIPVFNNENLIRPGGVTLVDNHIEQIQMESNRIFKGKIFIDATYEGDLLAAANISFIIGREPNSVYGETHNGIIPNYPSQLGLPAIDPYIVKGDFSSGLLPRIHPDFGGSIGDGDNGVQSFNFRMCLTDCPENRVMIRKPRNYNEQDYEIVLRASEAGMPKENFFKLSFIPNRKIDANNASLVSTDYIGMSWNWSQADHNTRKLIQNQHEQWQRGLVWTLQNHPRIRPDIQLHYSQFGLPKDEFRANKNWPYELYVREGRRMVSSYVITENTPFGETVFDSVGLADYRMDSHAVKYYVSPDNTLATEGAFFLPTHGSFAISYQALTPKESECQNLLVSVCISASHVAYGAIRMEPQYMILGQSAATAASLAIDLGVAVQNVPYDSLKMQLLKDGQIL